MGKSGKKRGLTFYFVVLALGLYMTFSSIFDAITLFTKDTSALSAKKIDSIKEGEMVSGDVKYVFDTIATLETSSKIYGIPYNKRTTPYYLVYLDNGTNGDDGFYALVHATKKDSITTMNQLMMSTQTYLTTESDTYEVSGKQNLSLKAEEIPSEVRTYMYDYFKDSGVTSAECDKMVAGYVLEEINYKSTKLYPFIGISLIILSTLIFILVNVARKKTVYVNEFPSGYGTTDENFQNGAPQSRYYSEEERTKDNSSEMDSVNADDYFK